MNFTAPVLIFSIVVGIALCNIQLHESQNIMIQQGKNHIPYRINLKQYENKLKDSNFNIIISGKIDKRDSYNDILLYARIYEEDPQQNTQNMVINSKNYLNLAAKKQIFINQQAFQGKLNNQVLKISNNEVLQSNFLKNNMLEIGFIRINLDSNIQPFLDQFTYSLDVSIDLTGTQCPKNCYMGGICNKEGECSCHINFAGKYCEIPIQEVDKDQEFRVKMEKKESKFFFIQFQLEKGNKNHTSILIKFKNKIDLDLIVSHRFIEKDLSRYPTFENGQKIKDVYSYMIPGDELDQLAKKQRQDKQSYILFLGVYNNQKQNSFFDLEVNFEGREVLEYEGFINEISILKIIVIIMLSFFALSMICCIYMKIESKKEEGLQKSFILRQLDIQNQRRIRREQEQEERNRVLDPNCPKNLAQKLSPQIIDQFFPVQNIVQIREELKKDYPDKEFSTSDCAICLMEFEENEKCRMTLCLHSFHADCLDNWLIKNESCPVCRFKMNRKGLKKYLEQNEKRQKSKQVQNSNNEIKSKESQGSSPCSSQDQNNSNGQNHEIISIVNTENNLENQHTQNKDTINCLNDEENVNSNANLQMTRNILSSARKGKSKFYINNDSENVLQSSFNGPQSINELKYQSQNALMNLKSNVSLKINDENGNLSSNRVREIQFLNSVNSLQEKNEIIEERSIQFNNNMNEELENQNSHNGSPLKSQQALKNKDEENSA